MTWAEVELSHVDLGDKRREQRLIRIVEDLAAPVRSRLFG
jgi:hypothetical protein